MVWHYSRACVSSSACAALRLRAHQRCMFVAAPGTPRHPECLHTHMSGLEFPPTVIGATATTQLELCNGHRREITVVGMCRIRSPSTQDPSAIDLNVCLSCCTICAVAVKPPFVVRHQRFRIRSRSRVRLPVKFNPGGFIFAYLERIGTNASYLLMMCHCNTIFLHTLRDQRQPVLFNKLCRSRQTCQSIKKSWRWPCLELVTNVFNRKTSREGKFIYAL